MSSSCSCPDSSSLATAIREDSFNSCSSSPHPKSPIINSQILKFVIKESRSEWIFPLCRGTERVFFFIKISSMISSVSYNDGSFGHPPKQGERGGLSRCKGNPFRNIIQIFHYDSTTLHSAPTTLLLRSFLQLIVNYRLEYRKKYAKNFLVSIIILIFAPKIHHIYKYCYSP